MSRLRKSQFKSIGGPSRVLAPTTNIKYLLVGILLFGWLSFGDGSLAIGQTASSQTPGFIDGVTVRERTRQLNDSQQQSPPQSPPQSQLRVLNSKVRIVVEQNHILVIGSQEDVKTVVAAIEVVRKKMLANSDPTISEKIVLKFQLAETVTSIMSNLMEMHSTGAAVKISPLHFPEAVLIVGPASSVRHAKKLLAAIDSHDRIPKTKKPAVKKPAITLD